MVPSWSYRWFIKVWLNFPVSKDFSINFLLLVREPASLCLDEESPFHICPQPLLCPPHGLSSIVRDEDCVWLPLTGMGQFAGCKQNECCHPVLVQHAQSWGTMSGDPGSGETEGTDARSRSRFQALQDPSLLSIDRHVMSPQCCLWWRPTTRAGVAPGCCLRSGQERKQVQVCHLFIVFMILDLAFWSVWFWSRKCTRIS